jgi:hypothetical protein
MSTRPELLIAPAPQAARDGNVVFENRIAISRWVLFEEELGRKREVP